MPSRAYTISGRPGGNQPMSPEDLLGRRWGAMSHVHAAVVANTNAVVVQTELFLLSYDRLDVPCPNLKRVPPLRRASFKSVSKRAPGRQAPPPSRITLQWLVEQPLGEKVRRSARGLLSTPYIPKRNSPLDLYLERTSGLECLLSGVKQTYRRHGPDFRL